MLMLASALTWNPRLRGMSARRRSMTFSCLSAATSAGMVPRIAVRTACCSMTRRWTVHISHAPSA
jgi:hypothetical protein